jgi:hypothetical protein
MADAGADAARAKAIRAVEAVFERYRILAGKRPEDHIVSRVNKQYVSRLE